MSRRQIAAIVPVGPATTDLCYAVELVESLVRYEPGLACCVFLDDAPCTRGLSELKVFPQSYRAVTITNPRQKRGRPWRGSVLAMLSWQHTGICAGLLEALKWIQVNTEAAFALKIDTDALIIAPFSDDIESALTTRPDAGVIGATGVSCNPNVRAVPDNWEEPWLLRTHRLLPVVAAADDALGAEPVDIDGVGCIGLEKRRVFDRIRPQIERAIANGYALDESVEHGAFVVTRRMMDRMSEAGYFENLDTWLDLPFPENHVLAMYARAVGLATYDLSAPGEPFGLQCQGLPYTPEELLQRRHSLIHSVRSDVRYSESEIRQFFRDHAASGARSRKAS